MPWTSELSTAVAATARDRRPGRAWRLRHLPGALPGAAAGDTAEHRSVHEPSAARIIEVEEPAHELAGRKQAGYGRSVGVDDARARVDLKPAEGEGQPAGHGVG